MVQTEGNLKKDICLSLLALIVIVYVLFSGEPVGLSDNGDFDRIMYSNGLAYTVPAEQRRFTYQNSYCIIFKGETTAKKLLNALFHIEDFGNYPSIQHAFIKLSVGANILINIITGADIHVYRLEVLGLIYAFLYGLALFKLFSGISIRKRWLDTAVKLLIIVIFCDSGYVLYFNSFYGEAVQSIFLVFSLAFGLRHFHGRTSKKNYLLFILSVLGYGWSKFANIPAALLVLISLLTGVFMLVERKNRLFVVLSTTAVFVVLLIIYLSVPKWMEFQTNYNSVFFGILRNTDDKQTKEYIRELNLPPYMEKLKNTNYYMPAVRETVNSMKFREDFSGINKLKIAFFYLRHPGYFLEKLHITVLNSTMIRPAYLSNYGSHKPRLTFCDTFEIWGRLRKALPFNRLEFNFMIILAVFAYFSCKGVIISKGNRAKAFLFFGAAFSVTGSVIYNFCIPYIANGEGDIAKHLFAYIQSVDFLMILIIYMSLDGVYRIVSEFGHMPELKRRLIPAAFVLGLCVFIVLSGLSVLSKSGKKELTGAFIEFGEFDGNKIIWQIINYENGLYTLVAAEPVTQGSFSEPVSKDSFGKYGSNVWVNSKIRTYLNGDFLKCFSEEELSLIEPVNHKVVLSAGNISMKETGERELFWSHIPELSDRDYDFAYGMYVHDMVSLPNLKQVADMCRKGIKIRKSMPYWLDTPYYNNDSMLRTVEKDGYIYMKDAIVEDIGIVPCIYLRSGWNPEGEGTLKNPYRIEH